MLIRQSATPAPPTPRSATPTPAAEPVKPKRTVPLGLIIALNVVLVLGIALVLYFVFRPAPPNAVPAVPNVQAPATPAIPAPPSSKP